MTQMQTIDRLGLMLQCVGLPVYEKNLVNEMQRQGASLMEMRECVAFFWAGMKEFSGDA
jgi:hypothetical protein